MPTDVIGNANLWAKFGIEGLVIFALFMVLIFCVWLTIRRFDKVDERNLKASQRLLDQHREERKEWRESNDKQIDKFEQAITRLADGIKDSKI